MTKKQIYNTLFEITKIIDPNSKLSEKNSTEDLLLYIETSVVYMRFDNEALRRERTYLEKLLMEK